MRVLELAQLVVAICHRVIAKYTSARALRDDAQRRAEAAFERALALDPSLPLAHSLYAQLLDGVRGDSGFSALLEVARARHEAAASAFTDSRGGVLLS